MKTIKVSENQSLFDFAIQTAGSASAAFDIAFQNNLSVTDSLKVGQELIVVNVENKVIVDYYENKRLKPATGLSLKTIADFEAETRFFEVEFDNYFE
jgi:hypothetical protein